MSVGARMLPGLDQAAERMPFDQFGRYHMLREAVDACRKQLKLEQLSILDVGGIFHDHTGAATLPILEFLPDDEVKVLDIVDCDLPQYIKGDGTALDFEDNSFDLVVSCDTLEHIPRPVRKNFWNELLRVAKHGVILLAPFGNKEVETAESILFRYIKNDLGAIQVQLQEHQEYKLPRLGEWLDYLQEHDIHAQSFPTGYLPAWLGMMLIKHLFIKLDETPADHQDVDYFYNLEFFPTERRNPAYRHLIIAEHTAGLVDAVTAVLEPTLMPDLDDQTELWGQALVPLLNVLTQRQITTQDIRHNESLDAQRIHYEEHLQEVHTKFRDYIQHTTETIKNHQQHTSALERILADQQIQINHLSKQIGQFLEQQAELLKQLAQRQEVINSTLHQQAVSTSQYTLEKRQLEAAMTDLEQRSEWLEQQNKYLTEQLQAVENGIILRVLKKIK